MNDKLCTAIARLNDYKDQVRHLPKDESIQIFALAAMIKGNIDRNPRFGLPALTLVGCEVAVELQDHNFKHYSTDLSTGRWPFGRPRVEMNKKKEFVDLLKNICIDARIIEVHEDVKSKRDRYRVIDPFELADLLDVASPESPNSMDGWCIARYMKKKSIYEIIDHGGYESFDSAYVWEKMRKARKEKKLERFLSEFAKCGNLDCENIDKILNKFDQSEVDLMVFIVNKGLFDDGHGAVIGSYTVECECRELCFEAIVEDDGSCIDLKGPYDDRDGEFFDTTDCLTEDWI